MTSGRNGSNVLLSDGIRLKGGLTRQSDPLGRFLTERPPRDNQPSLDSGTKCCNAYLKQPHGAYSIVAIEGEAVVDASRKDEHVTGADVKADPVVGRGLCRQRRA